MTYGEAKEFVAEFLRGDNGNALVSHTHFKMAMLEIGMLCVPTSMKVEYTGTETDVLRLLPSEEVRIDALNTKIVQYYVKSPVIPTTIVDAVEMPIDNELGLAVTFFICSYLSNKYKDNYEAKANKQVSIYTSNIL
jgi:hypothetical protein